MAAPNVRTVRSYEEAVEVIGLGCAQLQTAILAYGVWVADGVELSLVFSLAKPISEDLQISWHQRATLPSVVFFGLALGGVISRYGDSYGRRVLILLSYYGTIAATLLMSVTHSFPLMVMLRVLFGIFMGVGMATSLALVNEVCPQRYRMVASGLRGVMYSLGGALGSLIIALDDPSLQNLSWRRDLALSTILPAFLGLWATRSLHESLMFLSLNGRSQEANQNLEWMATRNGLPAGYLRVEESQTVVEAVRSDDGGRSFGRSWFELVGIAFNRQYAASTICLSLLCFVNNFVEYGCQYAEPIVLPEAHSGVAAGWQMVTKATANVPVRIAVMGFGLIAAETITLVFVYGVVMAPSLMMFALTAAVSDRVWWQGLLYYFGLLVPLVAISVQYMVIYKAAADMRPPIAAATRAGIVIGVGRAGSMVAPFVFEIFRHNWVNFYIILTTASVLAALVAGLVPNAIAPFASLEDE
eukprot:CAMPEP_0178408902 /NCGR_PEP_ID=MMETSP0689_2-20121128/20182_1 /TAXON_ID=160604 /ORGANISM="Amphidinium massartii, Strain CS-259" /LENGTH=470 /DNA_ID=CAMNT_0020030019 /DNA_START=8 /DNA_END=1417 /DNA_ORIENTATION=+